MKQTIFLLGAGASVDAGLPTVAALTKALRQRLPKLQDVNGKVRPEFGKIFDLFKKYDSSVESDYERFFEWMRLTLDSQKQPFRRIINLARGKLLVRAMAHLTFVVGAEIARLLTRQRTSAAYLGQLAQFVPKHGRLKVFSLNYDCCLEDTCRNSGIYVATGFDRITKRWRPSQFREIGPGINLYKLHGSLRWFLVSDKTVAGNGLLDREFQFIFELRPQDRKRLAGSFEISPSPELVLGPATKVQVDDPFLTLFCEFHKCLKRAKACVLVGYGHHDPHVNSKLVEATKRGTYILDVRPGTPNSNYLSSPHYYHLKMSAKDALTRGYIKRELARLGV